MTNWRGMSWTHPRSINTPRQYAMTTMSSNGDVRIVISQDGLHYKERGTLGWMSKEIEWSDVSSVRITDVSGIDTNGDSYPFKLEGNIVVGEEGTDTESSDEEKDVLDEIHAATGIGVNFEGGRVSFDPTKSDAENFREFFRYLLENGYIKRSDLPFKTAKQENFILNTENRHPNGEMRRGQEIVDGVWLETSIPVNQKQHHILEAAKTFLQ